MKVFFDSDVIISGSFSNTGASHILLQLAEVSIIHGFLSPQVQDECRRNIKQILPTALAAFEGIMSREIFQVIKPRNSIIKNVGKYAHQKDVPILAAAVSAESDYLVSFNIKDYFPPEELIAVLTPGELLLRIQREREAL